MNLIIESQNQNQIQGGEDQIQDGEEVEAELIDVEDGGKTKTPYGVKKVINFWFRLETGKPIKESCIDYMKEGSNSKLSRFVRGMLGEIPDRLDAAQIVGESYLVTIEKNKGKDGRVWDNITEIKQLEVDSEESDEILTEPF